MLGPVVMDVSGTTLTEDDRRRIASPLVGMVILFTRNFENPEQLRALCREYRRSFRQPVSLNGRNAKAVHTGGGFRRQRRGSADNQSQPSA